MGKPAIAIHGGAGTILKSLMTPEKEKMYRTSLRTAVMAGWKILESGGSAVDAVTESVKEMEDDPIFNAGKGCVFTSKGSHEMDAAIMNGADLNAGSVALIGKVRNPILLARAVMERTHHVLLCGEDAESFAESIGLQTETPDYFFVQSRFDQLQKALEKNRAMLDHSEEKGHGTVGAVAVDVNGDLAAATSTGGMTNKSPGRVGDSAITGAGNYADNSSCAVSCTGEGEFFIRCVTAYEVSALIRFAGKSLAEAAETAIMKSLAGLGGKGGLIAVDKSGNISMPMNSEGMYRACFDSSMPEPLIGIFSDEKLRPGI